MHTCITCKYKAEQKCIKFYETIIKSKISYCKYFLENTWDMQNIVITNLM